MPIVKMPDGKRVKFPDSMTSGEINAVISGEEKAQLETPSEGGITESWWERTKKDAPEMIGATIGGIAGGLSPPGNIPGAIGGAVLGGGAGRAYKQLYQHATGSPDAPKTSFEAAKSIGLAGIEQGAYEAVGGLVAAGAAKTLAPFAKTVSKRGIRAMKVLDEYMPKKMPPLLPAQVTEHRGLDWIHSIAEHSIGGGNVIFKHTEALNTAMSGMTDDLATAFGSKVSPTELGQTVVDVAQGGWKTFKNDITSPMYKIVEKRMATKGDIVSTLGLKNAIADKVAIVAKMKGIAGEESGDALVKAIQELPDMVDYAVAQDLRKRLYSLGSKFKAAPGGESGVGLAKHLTKITDGVIDKALATADKSTQRLWRGVNRIYREGSEKYNNIFIRSLIKRAERSPDKVLNGIFQKGGIKSIERIKKITGPETWEQLQGWYIRDVIERTSTDGILRGPAFMKNLFNPATGMGREGVEAIFGKEGTKRIKEVGNAIRVAQENVAKTKAGGGMMIQLMQASAIVGAAGIFTGRMPKGGAVLLGGPYAIAKILANKKASRWLTIGLKQPRGSAQFAAAMARLSDFINIDADKPIEMPF